MDWDAYLNLQYQLLLMKTRIMQIYGSAGQGFDATGLVLPNLYAGMGTFAAGVPDASSIAAFHAAQAQNLLSQAASASGPVGLPVLNVATFLEALREEKEKEERQRSADNANKQHINSGVTTSTSVGTATGASANPSLSASASSAASSHSSSSSSNSKKEKKKKKKERKEARRAERERERQAGARETRASKKEVVATPTSTPAVSSQPRSSPSAAASSRDDKADTHHGIDLLAALAEQAEQQRHDRASPPAGAAAPNTRPFAGGSEQRVAAEVENMEEEEHEEEGAQGRRHKNDEMSTDHVADTSHSGKRRLRSSGQQKQLQQRLSSSAQSEDSSDHSVEPSPAGSPTHLRRSGRSRKTKSFDNVEEGLDAAASNKKRRTTPAEQESKPEGGPMTSGATKGEESRHGAAVMTMDLETTHEAAQRQQQREEVSTRPAVTLSAVKLEPKSALQLEPEPELLAEAEPTTSAEEEMLVTARNPAYTMEPRQVVVIGAGIAGISAAIQLQHAGYRVTILEARERAGGRIKTMKKEMKGSKSSHLSIAIELGASFIKGAEGNPIARLCESLGLHTQQVPAERCLLFDHSGRTVPKPIEQQAQTRFHAMLGHAHAARHMRKRRDEERQEREAEQEKMQKAAADKGSSGGGSASRKPNKSGRKDALKISTSASSSLAAKRDKGGKSRKGKGAAPSKGSSADDDDEGDREAEKAEETKKKKEEEEEEEEEEEDEEERLARARKALLDELVASFDDTTTLQQAMDRIAELRASLPPASSTATATADDDALAQPPAGPERDRTEAESEARVVDWHAAMLEGCVGAPLSRLSLFHWDQENATQYQGPHSLVKEGHAALIDELVVRGKLDLRLNHVVESVDYSDDGGLVKLGTNQGAFEADLVVCTLPLGVLKQGAVQFVPPLPEEKRRSIERLGCGTFNVVVLFFSTIFWDKQTFWFGRAGEHQGRSYLYLSMTKVFGYPVLVAYQSGQAAEEAEAQEDSEIVDEALTFLHTVYKNSAKPLKSIVTRWTSDPYSGGAHSYIPPGATGADYDVLAAPVAARLFFAGEATNRRHPSSVAGAYVSGKREAERITALYGVVPVGDRPTSEPGPAEPIDLNHLDKTTAAAAPSPAPTPTIVAGAKQTRPTEEMRSVKAEPEEREAEKKRKAGEVSLEARPANDDNDDNDDKEEENSDKSPVTPMSPGPDAAPTTTTMAAAAGKRRRIAKRKRRDGGAKSSSPELIDSPQLAGSSSNDGDRPPAGGVATIKSEDDAAAQRTIASSEEKNDEHIMTTAARSGRRTRPIPAEDDNDDDNDEDHNS